MPVTPRILPTEDGTDTLIHPVFNESYHSTHGAQTESDHVFIVNGFEYVRRKTQSATIRVLEIGFGSGLNALLTAKAAQIDRLDVPQIDAFDTKTHELRHKRQIQAGNEQINRTKINSYSNVLTNANKQAERMPASDVRDVSYTAVELYPVSMEAVCEMSYAHDPLFLALHSAPWGRRVDITPHFSLTKLETNLLNTALEGTFDVVYFDAFSPDTQPEMWGERIFKMIFDQMSPNAVLVTYSAKGDVKRALRAAGFQVRRLPGAPGKRHMLQAVKSE